MASAKRIRTVDGAKHQAFNSFNQVVPPLGLPLPAHCCTYAYATPVFTHHMHCSRSSSARPAVSSCCCEALNLVVIHICMLT